MRLLSNRVGRGSEELTTGLSFTATPERRSRRSMRCRRGRGVGGSMSCSSRQNQFHATCDLGKGGGLLGGCTLCSCAERHYARLLHASCSLADCFVRMPPVLGLLCLLPCSVQPASSRLRPSPASPIHSRNSLPSTTALRSSHRSRTGPSTQPSAIESFSPALVERTLPTL